MKSYKINSKTSRKKLLVVYSTYLGNTGDAVNERQLINHLCKQFISKFNGKCYVFYNLSLKMLFKYNKFRAQLQVLEGVTYIPILLTGIVSTYYIFSSFFSLVIALAVYLYSFFTKHEVCIYVRNSWNALGFLLMPMLRNRTLVKLVSLGEEEVTVINFVKRFIISADRHALARARIVGLVSPLLLKYLVFRRGVIPSGSVVAITPGIDLQKVSKIMTKGSNGVFSNEFVVAFVGSLVWWQGIDVVVKAVSLLRRLDVGKRIKLVIVGDGPDRRKIEILCNKLGVNCEMVGSLPHFEALKVLARSHVLVLPRPKTLVTESVLPIKIIEAWALGVPVIATDHEIFKFYGIRDREHILFCKPEPSDVAKKIIELLYDKSLYFRLSTNSRKIAEKFDYQKIANILLERLLNVCTNKTI
ncbi:glycosyl transferase, group 1 [Pyrobaculum ferrireducens]|uniref:Glycosyl transferase, group 1 n=1 Tax=Pyrobaculum ferrireducens TaxID=1104324 RepID=G7VIC4_9CREN|nr:glycosyl transferase, group 1 [Pyrobaculum ferrireducens]